MTTTSGLDGKSVVVTGGASGIGRAAVDILLTNGARVTVGDLNEQAGQELLAELAAQGFTDVNVVRTDVSDESDVAALVAAAVARFGRLDAAVNCAGLPPRGVLLYEMGAEQWLRSQSINLSGAFYSVKHEMAAMVAAGHGGAIVTISSGAAEAALPASAEYTAAKSGVNGLVRAAAIDGGRLGIRVNGIMPGPIDTPMLRASSADNADFDAITASVPLGRVGTATEVAAAATWLISDQAAYVTGVVLAVDGGLLAQ